MQFLPANWPSQASVEELPKIMLKIIGGYWPPESAEAPQGTAVASSWSVSRAITGSPLPGQVRAASGHSIASGSISFVQPEGQPLSPWARGARELGPGGECVLFAAHDGNTPNSGVMLGSFVIAPIKGKNTSNTVDLDLDESSIRMRRTFNYEWFYDTKNPDFEASAVLEKIAEFGGYKTTDIEPTGSILNGLFNVEGKSAWELAQEIAAATMGAVWVTETGVFTYRNRSSLRGNTRFTETVEALDSVESLDWTIDPGEIADRVEFTYTPTVVTQSDTPSITLWEATEKIRVRAGQTATLYADLNGTAPAVSSFLPAWNNSSAPDEQHSRWAAAIDPNGGGARPADNAIRVNARFVSASRVRLEISNRTDDHLWLVDGNGQPCLILRSNILVAPGEQTMLDSGKSAADALNPLSVDAGMWVQDHDTAQTMLSWISGQTERAQAFIEQVRVAPNLARQIGDVIKLTDNHTNLLSKALITGITLGGDGSGYQQHLNLVLLDLTFTDWDAWMQSNGINTFQQLDAFLADANINTFEQFDVWGKDFGGTL